MKTFFEIKFNNIFLTTSFFILLFTESAFAYLDPGTGSIIIQAIVGAAATLITLFKSFKYQVKKRFLIFSNSFIFNFLNKYKEFIASILIFYLPILIFFKPYNLKQLGNFDIKYIIIFHTLLFILIIIFSLLSKLLFKNFENYKKINLIFLLCFFSYLQFFYKPSIELFMDDGKFYFLLFEVIVLIVILFIYKFKNYFVNLTLIFSLILTFYYGSTIVNFYIDQSFKRNNKNNNIPKFEINDDVVKINETVEKKNIYLFLFDGMMSLESASKFNIVSKDASIKKLNNLGIKYISDSFSNYKDSYLTIASIFNLDYPIKDGDDPYIDRDTFFPNMLSQNNDVNLLNYLTEKDVNFYWGGNTNDPCLAVYANINCISDNFYNNITLILLKFYVNTPIYKIYYKVKKNAPDRFYPSDDLIRKFDLSKSNKNKFFFIHNFSPRTPYFFEKNCSKNPEFNFSKIDNKIKDGYKKNYLCALKKIELILEYLKNNDPGAIIIIQSDHGWSSDLGETLSDKEKIIYRAKIFNAIKAPEKCFTNFGLPKSNINSIRFVLNCALGYNLKKVEDFHFISFDENNENYGKVINKTELIKY